MKTKGSKQHKQDKPKGLIGEPRLTGSMKTKGPKQDSQNRPRSLGA